MGPRNNTGKTASVAVTEEAGRAVEDVNTETGAVLHVEELGINETAGRTAEDVHTDTGGVLHVKGLGPAAVALGQAVAVQDGGPGVGEAQMVERAEGIATRTTRLDDGVGRDREHVRDERGYPVRAAAVAARRPGVDDILPLSGRTIDPTTVPGVRLATAATQVRRDGKTYLPGESFLVDFRAHSELVLIGAIVATPWHELPGHGPDDD